MASGFYHDGTFTRKNALPFTGHAKNSVRHYGLALNLELLVLSPDLNDDLMTYFSLSFEPSALSLLMTQVPNDLEIYALGALLQGRANFLWVTQEFDAKGNST